MTLKLQKLDAAPGPQDRSSRRLIRLCVLAVGGFVVWAQWAELDQITRAQGQVIASSRNQVIQAADGGVLEALMVREGDTVKRGQVLYRFDTARPKAAWLEARAKTAALKASVARLNAEVFGHSPRFPAELDAFPEFKANQQALFTKRQTAVNEEIEALKKTLALIQAELDMNAPLVKTGDVSRAEMLKLMRQVADIEGQITNRRNRYLQEAQTDLAKALEELASAEQILAQRQEQLDWTQARAPMDGIVRNVRLTTQGGVARAGEEIMQIVPLEDDLLIEAKVRPADAAFVKPGLPASVKLDAYDYTIYGTLSGKVSYISADTLNEETRANESPYYRVQIKTPRTALTGKKGEPIEITPGMTATVEIKTGSHTVWRYLSKPITKTVSESLGER
jgi:adhesin transport system membrane fusion protein